MRSGLFPVLLLTIVAAGACVPSAPAAPTPNIESTVAAAVQATVAARSTITPTTEIVTGAELAQAMSRAAFLTDRYGVPQSEVETLTTATYDAAKRAGINTVDGRMAVDNLVLDFAEHGGTGLRSFRIEGDDDSIARQLGYGSGASLRALTPSQVVHARMLVATIGLTKYVASN